MINAFFILGYFLDYVDIETILSVPFKDKNIFSKHILLEKRLDRIGSFGLAKCRLKRWAKPNVPIVRWLPKLPLRAKARGQNKIFIEAVIIFLMV
jgi:hypothetical protein